VNDPSRQWRGSNHSGMREFNARMVLDAIRSHGALPKADLARITQLSTQTVSLIVNRLLEDGLLQKCERIRGKMGQPSVPLALNPDGAFSVGVQVGRRSLEVVVTDFCGQLRHQWAQPYSHPAPRQVLPKIRQGLQRMQRHMGAQWERVIGLGLSAPLFMDQWGDLLGPSAHGDLKEWATLDLQQAVSEMTDLPVAFAKDTTAACLAELVQGQGQQLRDFLYVFVGTFAGGGLVLEGRLVGGARGNAAAIGSMPLSALGASPPPQLLQVASGWPLEQALVAQGHAGSLLHDARIVEPAYDAITRPWLRQAGRALAMCATSATALLDLDAVVIDSSLSPALCERLRDQCEAALSHFRQEGIHPPKVLAGRVGAHARAIGAALLPLYGQYFPNPQTFRKND
jgi:predicted NBD/HSP70 family sugar kinase